MRTISENLIGSFKTHLLNEEKSASTLEKYIHDCTVFSVWLGSRTMSKELVLEYKQGIMQKLAPASVNAVISSLNSFFEFCDRVDCKIKSVKIQKQIFASSEKELTKSDYEKLLKAALNKGNERLFYLMQTICSTGIRVSELKFITVEAIESREAFINCKGKMRVVMLTKQLCKILKEYVKRNKIKRGPIFVTRTGRPLNRSNIWADMKKLCESAGVSKDKVFPHNLRHLFAKTYYSLHKDIVRLADILGHASVNTTRIYTMESGEIHRQQIQELNLLYQRIKK
ncbi:tyrosine-type recombinase/integrase [Congzhengia sp.]|uniref:tyrosine-type recombinase/integrase n=1 Tax=Congzhengia sp. TaxID=2944168 RepID=UPI0030770135